MMIEILNRINNTESVLRLSSRGRQGRGMTVDSQLALARGISESWAEQWPCLTSGEPGRPRVDQAREPREEPGVRQVILWMVRQVLRKMTQQTWRLWIGWKKRRQWCRGTSVEDQLAIWERKDWKQQWGARQQGDRASWPLAWCWRRNRCMRRVLRTRFGTWGKLSYIKCEKTQKLWFWSWVCNTEKLKEGEAPRVAEMGWKAEEIWVRTVFEEAGRVPCGGG